MEMFHYSEFLRFVILNEVKNPVFMRVMDSSLRSVEDPGLSGNDSFSNFLDNPMNHENNLKIIYRFFFRVPDAEDKHLLNTLP